MMIGKLKSKKKKTLNDPGFFLLFFPKYLISYSIFEFVEKSGQVNSKENSHLFDLNFFFFHDSLSKY